MRPNHIRAALLLVLLGLLSAACGSATTATPVASDRVATRVAEELSVAATLTARAQPGDTPAAPVPTEVVAESTVIAAAPAPPAATATPVSASAPTQEPFAASCRVLTAGLSLRSGPGTVYAPPLAGLARNTELRPLTFVGRGFPTGQWIEVQVVPNGILGWVSAGQQFVACNVQIASLPAGLPPPTPTPAPTATLLPPTTAPIAPPATQPAVSNVPVIPVDGSDGNRSLGNNRGVNQGRNLLLPGFADYEAAVPMVFGDKIVFQAEVFDKEVGQSDGAGIDYVTFTIRDESGEKVHERTERNAGYCVFGGGEPDCIVWRFSEHGDKWPGGASVQPGVHDVQIFIQPKQGEAVTWFWSFRIEG